MIRTPDRLIPRTADICSRKLRSAYSLLLLAHVLCYATPGLYAQSPGLPRYAPAHYLLERASMLSGVAPPFHPALQGYTRADGLAYALTLDSLAETLPPSLRADLDGLFAELHEGLPADSPRKPAARKPLAGIAFRSSSNMLEVATSYFRMQLNPMLDLQWGGDRRDSLSAFANRRGLELRAEWDDRLYIYSNLIETQARFPQYVRSWTRETLAIPGAGFFKTYRSRRFDSRESVDYNVATAYLGYRLSRHTNLQMGHGARFVGHGFRSMFLSDFAPPNLYLQWDVRVWRLHYRTLWTELSPVAQSQIPDGVRMPRKYAAIHYLSYRFSPRLSVGFFEAVTFNRSRQFEWQYLNPIIFYRSVEGMIGSPDNVLLGAEAHWDPARGLRCYGQFVLDELVVSELLRERRGWWGNKYAAQLGLKYADALGVKNLDLQLECNLARPYTYAHDDSLNSYTHYNQALAHPLGANFAEWIGAVRYRPHPRLWIFARVVRHRQGSDTPGHNWGGNPLLSYRSRVQEYNNRIAQGNLTRTQHTAIEASWALGHNLFATFQIRNRLSVSDDPERRQHTQLVGCGLRWNLREGDLDW